MEKNLLSWKHCQFKLSLVRNQSSPLGTLMGFLLLLVCTDTPGTIFDHNSLKSFSCFFHLTNDV